MFTDIFTSPGASLLILVIQGLFAWALWSLRRIFVRGDDYLLHLQREARRESATARRLSALEEHLRQMPAGDDMAALRGEIQALNVRISGLDRLLERLEHGLDRQEDRLRLLPGPHCAAGAPLNGSAR